MAKKAEYVSKLSKLVQVTDIGDGVVQMTIEGEIVDTGIVVSYGSLIGFITDGRPVIVKHVAG